MCLCMWRPEFNSMLFSIGFHFIVWASVCACVYTHLHMSEEVIRYIFLYNSLPYSFKDLSLNLELVVFLAKLLASKHKTVSYLHSL